MAYPRPILLSAIIVIASASAAAAGPCSNAIDAMQARIDAKVASIAASGPFLPQGVFAGMSDQPTPRSIAAAEVKAHELSPQTFDTVRQNMAQARAADAAGNAGACRKALADVRHALGP
jgi:hypothetical protein